MSNSNVVQVPTNKGVITSKIKNTSQEILKLKEELNELFPERENLISQLIFALLMKEHVLVYGVFGTGKSLLANALFSSFTNAETFSIELTKFMTESSVIGVPNPKTLREEGVIKHETKGTIIEAQFAELDELFDANDYLLRTLLGILNERRFHRGIQKEKAKLHTAVASTNGSPKDEVARSKQLGAVVDRFLFQSEVEYIENDDARRQMFSNFVDGIVVKTKIPYADLEALVKVVSDVDLSDPFIIDTHNQVIQAYKKEANVTISDRRACKVMNILKASAVLSGRSTVEMEDYMNYWTALANGNDDEQIEKFLNITQKVLDKIVSEQKPDVIKTQNELLLELEGKLPELRVNNWWKNNNLTTSDIVELLRRIIPVKKQAVEMKPAHSSVKDRKDKFVKSMSDTEVIIGKLINGEKV